MSTVGVEQAGGRWRYAFAAAVLLAGMPAAAAAQDRVTEEHGASEPEGRLLAFYAAAVAFSPAGFLSDDALTLGLDACRAQLFDLVGEERAAAWPEPCRRVPGQQRLRPAHAAGRARRRHDRDGPPPAGHPPLRER